jgi:hypothetical protein
MIESGSRVAGARQSLSTSGVGASKVENHRTATTTARCFDARLMVVLRLFPPVMVSFTCEPSCHTRSSTPIAANSILMSTFLVWKHFHPERLGSRVQDTE